MTRTAASLAVAILHAVVPAPAAPAEELLVDGIAAQVGSDIVLVSEVMRAVAMREVMLRRAGAPDVEIMKLRASGLDQMIEWRLIEKVVRQTELYASDKEIDDVIASIANENGLTLEQLRSSVTTQGLTFEDYRAQIKQQLERQRVINAMVASQVRVEMDDLHRLYEERFADQPEGGSTFHLRQLLVTHGGPTGRTPEEACAAVRRARARIEAGEPFENLAEELSDVAPREGGDIGWLHADSLAGWMEDIVAPLTVGETSDVVELPFGCSLLKLVERRDFEPVTFEQAQPMLHREVFEQRIAEEFQTWIDKLRENTYIERHGYFAEAAQLGSKSPYAPDPAEEEDALLP